MSKKVITVQGEGPLNAKVMVIGEAPGANEVDQGRPFVGKAGQTLDEWLAYLGIPRDSVYITNVVKEKIPGNKAPSEELIDAYISRLLVEINQVRPKLIILLGKTPVSVFIPEADALKDVFGNICMKRIVSLPIALFPLYHPSYINRMGRDKKDEVFKALDNLKSLVKNLDHDE